MAKVMVAMVFQVVSEFGKKMLSDGSTTDVLQIPVFDAKGFASQVEKILPTQDMVEITDTSQDGLIAAAEAMLPKGGDWTLRKKNGKVEVVTMNSCLVGKEWKPCKVKKLSCGFVVQYKKAGMMLDPLEVDRDQAGTLQLQLRLDVMLMLQVA